MLCASIDQRTRRHRHLAGARRHESERQGPPRATFPSRGGTRTDAGGVAGVSERVSNRHAASHVSSGWARLPGRRPNNRSRLRPRLPNGQPACREFGDPTTNMTAGEFAQSDSTKIFQPRHTDYGPGVELLLVLIRYAFHLLSLLDSQPSRVTSLSSAPHPLRQHGPREEW